MDKITKSDYATENPLPAGAFNAPNSCQKVASSDSSAKHLYVTQAHVDIVYK